MGRPYRDLIVAAEDTLKTWDYLRRSLPGYQMHMFELLDVEPWLWELMHRFVREFDTLQSHPHEPRFAIYLPCRISA